MAVNLKVRDIRWYGMRPDTADQRDLLFEMEHPLLMAAPIADQVDLRASLHMPPVWDQGQLGSCVAHGVGANFQYLFSKTVGGKGYKPSRLAIYYAARQIENTVNEDAGCEIRDGIKAVATLGAAHESLWPYKISKFAKKPSARVLTDGTKHLALKYARVVNEPNDLQMAASLSGGLPVVIGISVYESFESDDVAKTGNVPLPEHGEQMLGGHCMLAIGYRTEAKERVYLVRNSWSATWGDAGHCWIPASYLINSDLASDFWAISGVE